MNIAELISDKNYKAKEKTALLGKSLLDKKISVSELLKFAATAKDSSKATCIEALEFATKKDPKIANKKAFEFVTQTLADEAPRVKWESAKVIANTAHLFKDNLDDAIKNLLDNTEHSGTVVRWSSALALGEVIKLKTKHNKDLLPAIEAIANREQENSIKKIYAAALKKAKAS